MSALDIVPPSAPRIEEQKRSGLFSRLFKRRETRGETLPEELGSFDEAFDLEDIKRRIGIDEPTETVQETMRGEAPSSEPIRMDSSERPSTAPPLLASDDILPLSELLTSPEPDSWDVKGWDEPDSSSSGWAGHEPAGAPEASLPEDGWVQEQEETPPSSSSSWADDAHIGPLSPGELFEDAPDTMPGPSVIPEQSPFATSDDDSLPDAEPDGLEPRVEAEIAEEELRPLHEDHARIVEELETLTPEPIETPLHPMERNVPDEHAFILKNGRSLRNLRELAAALEVIDDDTFFHHVNQHKNDFANWVAGALNEQELAARIRRGKARDEVRRALADHEKKSDKRHAEAYRRICATTKTHTQKLRHAIHLAERLGKIHHELKERSARLTERKEAVATEMNARFADELAKRLRHERRELRRLTRQASKAKAGYDEATKELEQRFKRRREQQERLLTQREERLAAKQESVKKLDLALVEERRRFAKERAEAKMLIAQAEQAKALLHDVKERQAHLAEGREALAREREAFAAEQRSINAKRAAFARQEKLLQETKASLNRREQELTRQESMLKKQQDDYRQAKAELDSRARQFDEEQKKIVAKLKAEQEKIDAKLKKTQEAEERLDEKLKERRRIAKYVDEAERSIKKHAVKGDGLHDYLDSRRTVMGRSPELPPADSVRHLRIYEMVDEARRALLADDLAKARELYGKIREAFNKEQFSPQEKSVLYNTIRELYDDIHLANLR